MVKVCLDVFLSIFILGADQSSYIIYYVLYLPQVVAAFPGHVYTEPVCL